MMDARQAVRDAMMAERKAGHWADPAVKDDPEGKHFGIKGAAGTADSSTTDSDRQSAQGDSED
jgi:GTP-binding protein